MTARSAERQLTGFLARYTPEIVNLARESRAKLQALLPGAIQLVYDNYNALVIGFGPTERASEAILSIALYPRWIRLFFLHGERLRDPHKVLEGKGKQVRHVMLKKAAELDLPAVRQLIEHACERCAQELADSRRGRLVIKSISEAQRPRRPR